MNVRASLVLIATLLSNAPVVMADPAVDSALQDVKKAVEELEKKCSSPSDSGKVLTSISDTELVTLLNSLGYSSASVARPGTVLFNMEGMKILLLNDGGSLQLYFSVSGTSADLTRVNAWNSSKRYSRAYLDKDKDPVLESDLMLKEGVTKEAISRFIQLFGQSLSVFRHEVAY